MIKLEQSILEELMDVAKSGKFNNFPNFAMYVLNDLTSIYSDVMWEHDQLFIQYFCDKYE